jgi:hypothetical protein
LGRRRSRRGSRRRRWRRRGSRRRRWRRRRRGRGRGRRWREKARERARAKVKEKVEMVGKREKVKLVEQGGGKTQLHSRGSSSSSAGRARRKARVQRSLPTCTGGLE